jgi:hypothetical protein
MSQYLVREGCLQLTACLVEEAELHG